MGFGLASGKKWQWVSNVVGMDFVSSFYNSSSMDTIRKFISTFGKHGCRHNDQLHWGYPTGTDRIALDAVGVAILRSFGTTPEAEQGRIFEQEQIARAVSLGLGVSRPEDIVLLTDDDASTAYAAQIHEVLLTS